MTDTYKIAIVGGTGDLGSRAQISSAADNGDLVGIRH